MFMFIFTLTLFAIFGDYLSSPVFTFLVSFLTIDVLLIFQGYNLYTHQNVVTKVQVDNFNKEDVKEGFLEVSQEIIEDEKVVSNDTSLFNRLIASTDEAIQLFQFKNYFVDENNNLENDKVKVVEDFENDCVLTFRYKFGFPIIKVKEQLLATGLSFCSKFLLSWNFKDSFKGDLGTIQLITKGFGLLISPIKLVISYHVKEMENGDIYIIVQSLSNNIKLYIYLKFIDDTTTKLVAYLDLDLIKSCFAFKYLKTEIMGRTEKFIKKVELKLEKLYPKDKKVRNVSLGRDFCKVCELDYASEKLTSWEKCGINEVTTAPNDVDNELNGFHRTIAATIGGIQVAIPVF